MKSQPELKAMPFFTQVGGAVLVVRQYDPLRPARDRWAPHAGTKTPTETVPERIVLAPGMQGRVAPDSTADF